MELKERRYSVLIVSAAESFNRSLKPLLPITQYDPVEIQTSVSAAKRSIVEKTYDFIIINAPLPDESGTRFAVDVCAEKTAVVLLLVRNELYEEAYDRFVKYGIFTLPKPTSKLIMHQALQWMGSARERLRKLEKKTMSLDQKMEEIRLVNRAKWILISQLKMSEPDAHRYIEKQAMDRCVSRREVAQEIIKTYE